MTLFIFIRLFNKIFIFNLHATTFLKILLLLTKKFKKLLSFIVNQKLADSNNLKIPRWEPANPIK